MNDSQTTSENIEMKCELEDPTPLTPKPRESHMVTGGVTGRFTRSFPSISLHFSSLVCGFAVWYELFPELEVQLGWFSHTPIAEVMWRCQLSPGWESKVGIGNIDAVYLL